MFTLNIILFICSALSVAFGGYLVSTKWDEYISTEDVSTDNFLTIGLFLVFGILFVVSLMGTVGLCKLSKCLLSSYSCILVLALSLQIGIVVFLVTEASDFDTESWLHHRWDDLSSSDRDWIEKQFNCCGFSYDYPDAECTEQYGYTEYCKDSITEWLNQLRIMVLALAAVVIVFEVLGTIISCMLIYSISQQGNNWRFNSYVEYSYMEDQDGRKGGHQQHHYEL